ncbi:MAG: nuclease-related domain-containing DEAD/DEAH box helicase [Candidatus Methylomirabilia bacterium]
MVPPAPPLWRPGWFAEKNLFEALRSGLPDEYHVFHDYAYLGSVQPREGAIDFLVVHRELGLLAIECKGEGVHLRGDGTWMRLGPGSREESLDESPFRQSQRHIKELVEELRPKIAQLFPELGSAFPFVYGHAVAFPSAGADRLGPLPAEVSPRIVLFGEDLTRLGTRVPEILGYWGSGRPPVRVLDERQFTQFRKHILLPRWKLAPTFGARLELDSQAIVRLSDEQVEVLRSLVSARRLCVRGGAGSGKTLLALELARTAALEGRQVLLTCFNIALARWLGETIASWGRLAERVRVATFHDLCREAAAATGDLPPAPPAGDKRATAAYWNELLPDRLLAALESGRLPRYDAVVVDEGQDFHRDWFDLLEGLLRNPQRGSFVIFYDPAQDIFGTGCKLPDYPATALGVNFRNTRSIAGFLQGLAELAAAPFSRNPEGEPPVFHRQPHSAAAAAEAVDRLVDELVNEKHVPPGRITVIAPHTRGNSCLCGIDHLAGQRLSTDPLDRAGAVLCTTIHKFKGLESDVVVLIDVREDDLFCGRAFLYTAAARARVLLHVFEVKG